MKRCFVFCIPFLMIFLMGGADGRTPARSRSTRRIVGPVREWILSRSSFYALGH